MTSKKGSRKIFRGKNEKQSEHKTREEKVMDIKK